MASKAQIAANRANAARSTGPRTDEGKAKSKLNAIRHGLCAEHLILFDETEADFAGFYDELRVGHAPMGAQEEALVERIAMAAWRLRRVWRAEAGAVNARARELAEGKARRQYHRAWADDLRKHPPGGKPLDPDKLGHLPGGVVEALREPDLPEPRDTAPPTLADYDLWPEAMTRLSRYEATLERILTRATKDLERTQALRRELAVAAARAAAEELAAERRREARAREAAAPPPAEPHPLTLAGLEAAIAKRSQYPAAPTTPPAATLSPTNKSNPSPLQGEVR